MTNAPSPLSGARHGALLRPFIGGARDRIWGARDAARLAISLRPSKRVWEIKRLGFKGR